MTSFLLNIFIYVCVSSMLKQVFSFTCFYIENNYILSIDIGSFGVMDLKMHLNIYVGWNMWKTVGCFKFYFFVNGSLWCSYWMKPW